MLGKYNKNSIYMQLNFGDADPDWGDDQDDFAYANLEDDFEKWDDDDEEDSSAVSTCRSPQDHRFERKLLLNSYYRECLNCGYSPNLDSGKPKFMECHKSFLEWEDRHKI